MLVIQNKYVNSVKVLLTTVKRVAHQTKLDASFYNARSVTTLAASASSIWKKRGHLSDNTRNTVDSTLEHLWITKQPVKLVSFVNFYQYLINNNSITSQEINSNHCFKFNYVGATNNMKTKGEKSVLQCYV